MTLDNLLIHIGYHKTASSWLQNRLFISDDKNFVPLSKRDRGASTLANHFFYDANHYLLSPFDNNAIVINDELQALLSRYDTLHNKVPVMSHERLSGNPHSSGFDARNIAQMLQGYFPDARILIVIREQKDFILSNYFQYLSIGGTHSLKKYLNTRYDGKRPYFSPNHVNYLPLVKYYCELFGKENVIVLPYELFRDSPADFLDNLGSRLGVEISVESSQFKEKLNRSKQHFLMYHLRALNTFKVRSSVNDYSPLANKYTKSASVAFRNFLALGLPKQLNASLKENFRQEIAGWVSDRYTRPNKDLAELIGYDLAQYGYD
jgi:Sulfotransferase domain